MDNEWQRVNDTTRRLAVPGGWVYEFERFTGDGSWVCSFVMVPDPSAAHCVAAVEADKRRERDEALSDADEAVALLRACGWGEARHDGERVFIGAEPSSVVIGIATIWATDNSIWWPRKNRTLVQCARVVIRDAVTRGIAPDMDAARALVASWGGA